MEIFYNECHQNAQGMLKFLQEFIYALKKIMLVTEFRFMEPKLSHALRILYSNPILNFMKVIQKFGSC